MFDWWELPGPSRFVATLAADLNAGVSVTVGLPAYTPDGLKRAIRHSLRAAEGIRFEQLRLETDELINPITLLFQRFLHWVFLGKTTGRGKQSNSHVPNRSIKEVLGYPLTKRF